MALTFIWIFRVDCPLILNEGDTCSKFLAVFS